MNIDFLDKKNPDYFFLAMSKLLDRAELRKHERDMIMGLCRQVQRLQKQYDANSDKKSSGLKTPNNERSNKTNAGHENRKKEEDFE